MKTKYKYNLDSKIPKQNHALQRKSRLSIINSEVNCTGVSFSFESQKSEERGTREAVGGKFWGYHAIEGDEMPGEIPTPGVVTKQ